jgi:hypothetical protein
MYQLPVHVRSRLNVHLVEVIASRAIAAQPVEQNTVKHDFNPSMTASERYLKDHNVWRHSFWGAHRTVAHTYS